MNDPKVWKSIGECSSKYGLLLCSVQEANECPIYALNEGGYDGSALQASLKAVPEEHVMAITEQHSKEQIELLEQATTHGKKFYATGGSHVCSDIFF